MKLLLLIAVAVSMILGAGSAGAIDWVNEQGPPHELAYVILQFPHSIPSVPAGQPTTVYGRVYHAGVTEADGAAAQVVAQLATARRAPIRGPAALGSGSRRRSTSRISTTTSTRHR